MPARVEPPCVGGAGRSRSSPYAHEYPLRPVEDTNPWAEVVRRIVEQRRRADLARQWEDKERISKLLSAAEDARRAWVGAVRGEKTTRRQTYMRLSALLTDALTSNAVD